MELTLTPPAMLAALAGMLLAGGLVTVVAGWRGHDLPSHRQRAARPRSRRITALLATANPPTLSRRQQRLRIVALGAAAAGVWLVTGWPIAAAAVLVVGGWLPWLLGSPRQAQQRIAQLEALQAWCRRMADTLAGGGAIGLTQAIVGTAGHAPEEIADPVHGLARRLRAGGVDQCVALREFADAIDDRVGDNVAAALTLALHQHSTGVARVLRQLADGVARDVRARREVEAERAEPRQSMRTLLVLQAGMLVMLALVPGFAAPYRSAEGQVVMATLLAGTVALLVWMRRLAAGRPAPRFLGGRSPRGARP